MTKRLNRKRARYTDSVGLPFRTGAAIDVVALVTGQNKKAAADALIWKALRDDPQMLAAVMAKLPVEHATEPAERSTIEWGRDAAEMSEPEKAAVLKLAERQSFRIMDVLVKLDERKQELAESEAVDA